MNGEDVKGWGGLKMVEIPTKDVGEVKDCFINKNYKWNLEEGYKDYIKGELEINE